MENQLPAVVTTKTGSTSSITNLCARVALPDGFTPVEAAVPDDSVPVLAIRKCGYTGATWEVLTCFYMPKYRPNNPWRTIGWDAVSDSGSEILGWKYASAWLL